MYIWSHYYSSSKDCPQIPKDGREDASFNQGILSLRKPRTTPSGLFRRSKRVVWANHMLLWSEFERTKFLDTPTFNIPILNFNILNFMHFAFFTQFSSHKHYVTSSINTYIFRHSAYKNQQTQIQKDRSHISTSLDPRQGQW